MNDLQFMPLRGPGRPDRISPPRRILVADDDGDIRHLNSEVLIHYGYRVDAAEDGAVAWEKLQRHYYNLLITDHDMPRLTGGELLNKLRAAHMVLPVIIASGTEFDEEIARSPWLQPAAALLKPYTVNELVDTVRTVLRVADDARAPMQPQTAWQRRPPADGWRL